MREEVNRWWKQSLKDLESAKKNFSIDEYYVSAFLCQQAVEKALKSLYIHILRSSPGHTHSLIFLGKSVNIPEDYLTLLKKISPDFILTRYPDASYETPHELYDKDIANERLIIAEKVMEWVRKQMEK